MLILQYSTVEVFVAGGSNGTSMPHLSPMVPAAETDPVFFVNADERYIRGKRYLLCEY